MDHESALLVFVIFHVEDLDLFLLLLAVRLNNGLGRRECLIVVLNDDFDYWFWGFRVRLEIVFAASRTAADIITGLVICGEREASIDRRLVI